MSRTSKQNTATTDFHGVDFNDNVVRARRMQARAVGDSFGRAAKAAVRFLFGPGRAA